MKKRRRAEPYAEGEDVMELTVEGYASDIVDQEAFVSPSFQSQLERQRWIYHKRTDEQQDY